MTKELRTVYLVVLTLIAYASFIYFDSEIIIFPFPLNEAIFLAVTIQFVYWNRKQPFIAVIVLLTSLFGFIGNQVYWSMLLSNESMVELTNTLWLDIFKILFGLGILTWSIISAIKQNNIYAYLLLLLFLALFSYGFTTASSLMIISSYLIQFLSVRKNKTSLPFHSLWLLLFFLESFAWLSFYLNK